MEFDLRWAFFFGVVADSSDFGVFDFITLAGSSSLFPGYRRGALSSEQEPGG